MLALLQGSIEEALMGRTVRNADDFDATSLHHSEVHQAVGMITEQAGVNAADAMARLSAAAFAADRAARTRRPGSPVSVRSSPQR